MRISDWSSDLCSSDLRCMTDWRRIFSLREAGVYYALLLLLGVLAALAAARGLPLYLSGQNLGNIAYQASLVGIMGVAMTVMLITGAFDMSVAPVISKIGRAHV